MLGRKGEKLLREFDYDKLIDKKIHITKNLLNTITAIHEYKGKQALYIEANPDILKDLLDIAKIQSTDASNRIEGIYTSDQRLKELVEKKVEPRNRNEQEIAGYREVLELIHDSYEYIELSPNILLQLHQMLYKFNPSGNAGRFKNVDNTIEEIDVKGNRRIRFKPVSAFETPQVIENLCTSFNKAIHKADADALILIPTFILDFLCIHPFNDGNGRMSRLLTLLLLYKAGYIVGKYISIENMIETSKETYYEVLEASSLGWHEEQNDNTPFLMYYLGIILATYREFENRVSHVRDLKMNKTYRIKEVIDKNLGKVTKSNIKDLCPDISVAMIEKVLGDLVKEGYVEKIGQGRSTGYVRKVRSENGE